MNFSATGHPMHITSPAVWITSMLPLFLAEPDGDSGDWVRQIPLGGCLHGRLGSDGLDRAQARHFQTMLAAAFFIWICAFLCKRSGTPSTLLLYCYSRCSYCSGGRATIAGTHLTHDDSHDKNKWGLEHRREKYGWSDAPGKTEPTEFDSDEFLELKTDFKSRKSMRQKEHVRSK